jgi:hypothetical protein
MSKGETAFEALKRLRDHAAAQIEGLEREQVEIAGKLSILYCMRWQLAQAVEATAKQSGATTA